MTKNDNYTNDKDVLVFLNNAVASMSKWIRVAPSREKTPNRFYAVVKQLVTTLREAMSEVQLEDYKNGDGPQRILKQSISNAELAFCLLLASVLVIAEDEDILPTGSPQKGLFMAALVKGVQDTIVPKLEDMTTEGPAQ